MALDIHERLTVPAEPQATLTLPFDLRRKSRLLTRLDDGREVRLFLPRGTVLRRGDLLRTDRGLVVEVEAAPEAVSTAAAAEARQLARACYHLGNRHIPVQIGPGWVRYLQDHVLDNLVRGLGLQITAETVPFEPEAGAYGGHGH